MNTGDKARKVFGWYSVGWVLWALGFAAIEGAAVQQNKHGGLEDMEHRTLTENIRFLAATDRDGQKARFRAWRRIGLLGGCAWLVTHVVTNGGYV